MKRITPILFLLLLCSVSFGQDYQKLANDLIQTKLSEDELEFDWTDALLSWAIIDNADRLNISESSQAKILSFYKKHDQKDLIITSPDLLVSVIGALKLEKRGHKFDFIRNKAISFLKNEPRNELETLDHVGASHRFFWWAPKTSFFVSSSLWTDSLIMYVIPAQMFARRNNDKNLEGFVRKQHKIFYSRLFDGTLYKHAYFLKDNSQYPSGEFYWLRGNAWVFFSLVELYETESSEEQKSFYRSIFSELAKNLINFLPKQGLFPTILTKEEIDNYVDTAGNSILLYSFLKAKRLGMHDETMLIERLSSGLQNYILKEGDKTFLSSCSGPTTAFKFYWYYTKIVGKDRNLGYCLGPFIMALGELELASK